jgi:CRP/FNR family cyclic AMP-dependent transcriptional regulator
LEARKDEAMSSQLEAVRSFRKVPIFRALTDDEMYEIIRLCHVHMFAAGHVLFRQREHGESAFIIESGQIEIVVESEGLREVIATLGPSEVLGELSLIDPGARSATAVVVEAVVLYELRGPEFQKLRDALNPAAYKVLRALSRVVCQRLRGVNEHIEAHLNELVTGRPRAISGSPRVAGAPLESTGDVKPAHETVEESDDLASMARHLFTRLFRGGGG